MSLKNRKLPVHDLQVIEEFATIEDDTEVHLLDVWKIDRDGEQERFSAYDDTKERMLLWYATDVPSVSIILKGGLKHNPPCNLYKTIDLFSRPRHFWNDCTTHYGKFKGEKNVGFMFLVELPLVNVANETVEDDSLNHGYLCAHTHSEREPDLAQSKILKLDGKDVIVPVGPLVDQKEWASECCLEDTYHVYDESLIRLRYLLKFSF
ncbi:poly [ADP-ribose] polymerase 3-like 2 [Homarus americanus]|uniref:Poly [ADP-ribose] polymerase n=1 Tax=Homarus americanus TaxID=6706 RepID=A0A8J5N1F2_HOMAM|nr:poly [ADP-ribose] polymerase 3-like 2 [Homarus americanus]